MLLLSRRVRAPGRLLLLSQHWEQLTCPPFSSSQSTTRFSALASALVLPTAAAAMSRMHAMNRFKPMLIVVVLIACVRRAGPTTWPSPLLLLLDCVLVFQLPAPVDKFKSVVLL